MHRITWRSLLALGITGGALLWLEALVVPVATLALGRVAFDLLLIVGAESLIAVEALRQSF